MFGFLYRRPALLFEPLATVVVAVVVYFTQRRAGLENLKIYYIPSPSPPRPRPSTRLRIQSMFRRRGRRALAGFDGNTRAIIWQAAPDSGHLRQKSEQ